MTTKSLIKNKYLISTLLGCALSLLFAGFWCSVDAAEDYLTVNYLSINDSAYERGEGVSWGDDTEAEVGEMVQFYIEAQNINSAFEAEDFTVKVYFPNFVGDSVQSWARVSTSSLPNTSSDRTYINIPENGRLVYQPGSVRVTADLDQNGNLDHNGDVWDDAQGRIDEEGINLGTLKGGAQTVQISFYAVVAEEIDPNLTVRYEVNNLTQGSGWRDQIVADGGDTLKFYVEVHNTAIPSTAENLTVWADFPDQIGGEVLSQAFALADNASRVEDGVQIDLADDTQFSLVSNSTRVTWDPDGDGNVDYYQRLWTSDVFADGGINFGSFQGCNPFILTLTFEAVVQKAAAEEVDLSIEKFVRWVGEDSWYESIDKDKHLFGSGEEVEYRIVVKNDGDEDAENVEVVDELPQYLKWVSGDGDWDNDERKVRFDLGTVGAGEERVLRYIAKVLDEEDLPSSDLEQQNIATLYEDDGWVADDDAEIWINGPEVAAAEVPKELPEAGADSLGLILISLGMVMVGWGMRGVKSSSAATGNSQISGWGG